MWDWFSRRPTLGFCENLNRWLMFWEQLQQTFECIDIEFLLVDITGDFSIGKSVGCQTRLRRWICGFQQLGYIQTYKIGQVLVKSPFGIDACWEYANTSRFLPRMNPRILWMDRIRTNSDSNGTNQLPAPACSGHSLGSARGAATDSGQEKKNFGSERPVLATHKSHNSFIIFFIFIIILLSPLLQLFMLLKLHRAQKKNRRGRTALRTPP